jgi:DNA-binding NtrC family response regulator
LAKTGEEAYACFALAPESFLVLISDQRIPGMQGTELIGKVLHLRPELPVVLVSGDKDIIGDKSFTKANFRHLQKPVPPDVMLATLETLLHQSTAG